MSYPLSNREKSERDATLSSPDPVVPNNPSSTAWTASHAFSNTSVRGRMAAAEGMKADAAKPKSYQQQVMDYHYGIYLANQAREKERERAEQQQAIDRANREKADKEREQQKAIDRENKERADRERERKKGQYIFKQRLLDGMYANENATPIEIAAVNSEIAAINPKAFGDFEVHQAALWKLRAGG